MKRINVFLKFKSARNCLRKGRYRSSIENVKFGKSVEANIGGVMENKNLMFPPERV